MGCACDAPQRASGWTPIPELSKPTEVLPEENFDCYARRAGNPTGRHDDATVTPYGLAPGATPSDPPAKRGRILNTTVVVDGLGQVSEQFELSPSDPPEPLPITWTADSLPPGLTLTPSGALTGTLPTSLDRQVIKLMIRATNAASVQVDAREYTLVPRFNPSGTGDDPLTLVQPYVAADGSSPLVTSAFGPRNHPLTGLQKLHTGIDIVAQAPAAKGRGTVVAAADGEVTFAGEAGGYGNLVKLNHYDPQGVLLCETRYAHCAQLLVVPGQKVAAGQAIATEGSTGA